MDAGRPILTLNDERPHGSDVSHPFHSRGRAILSHPEAPTTDDAVLVRKAQAGDLAAFEELVRRHQHGLFSYLYRMCRNTSDAEEMAQAAMVKAWEKLGGFRGASSFKTWLYRIGTNLCFNLRTRRNRPRSCTRPWPLPTANGLRSHSSRSCGRKRYGGRWAACPKTSGRRSSFQSTRI